MQTTHYISEVESFFPTPSPTPQKKGSEFLKQIPATYVQININTTKRNLNNPGLGHYTSVLPVWAPPTRTAV